MARTSDFVILPTGLAVDDLHPQVGLANELTHQHGVDQERLAFVLWRVGDSKIEIQHARAYIKRQDTELSRVRCRSASPIGAQAM